MSRRAVIFTLAVIVFVCGVGYWWVRSDSGSLFDLTGAETVTRGSNAKIEASAKGLPDDPGRVTQQEIELLLDFIDNAARRKDVDGIMRWFGPDAQVVVRASGNDPVTMDRQQYRAMLQRSFAVPGSYDVVRKGSAITVASDGQGARARFRSIEIMRNLGRELRVEADVTVVFQLYDDEPLISSLEIVVQSHS